ncbi:erythromycin esterase family protein [Actinophytocola glycyrrhizae]|uniref:Erythromycin esterase family protein n=1 Tax=Actinophytocola glycyrrhizae TaxID=2044873 RepID=A0ABV9S412_9PSEU
MSQDIHDLVTPSCHLLAFGEPTHLDPAFAWIRNDLFGRLVEHGFRSIAIESDRVAALAVNDFVQEGVGTLDAAMGHGFSHGFGDHDANRRLVTWMREHNESRPPEDRLSFHGFDGAMETMSAPSPRPYLEHAATYLAVDAGFAGLAGDDEQWSRTEAVMDPAKSVGATAEAERLRAVADDMLTSLYARAPELVAATSRAEWLRARTHLTTGLGLLRYHRQAAQDLAPGARWTRMCATRDSLMAQNLLDIRATEDRRGATLVFAHNAHLQRNRSHLRMGDMDIDWFSAGAIVASLVGDRYTFVAGSLREPEADTREDRITGWDLTTDRTHADPTLADADAVLHVSADVAQAGSPSR